MSNILSAEAFLKKAETIPVVDVRTPAEFEQGHIPGAINLPIFTNEERALVGTKYKRSSKESAVILGLELVGPKLAVFVKRAKKIAPGREILIHCWRGGMRSGSMAWLFSTAGFKAEILEGGYKGYRKYIRNRFADKANIVVVGGMTGSGKTEVLHELVKLNKQVLDLEGVAHHKGSAFGALGQVDQPTNEQYENDLYEAWKKFDLNQTIWIEDESNAVGSVRINDPLFEQMRNAPVIKMEVPKEERIKRLVLEYANFEVETLKDIVRKIERRLGGQHVKRAFECLDQGDFAAVADITLNYYDKAYSYGLETRGDQPIHPLELEKDDPVENAKKILEFSKKI